MTDLSADLETEIRRLRIRIIGLSPQQLGEPGPNSPETGTGKLTRRETIAEALSEFSSIGSGGRPVPDLGDQSLADQVVVLIESGTDVGTGTDAESCAVAADDQGKRLSLLLDAAVRLRRSLA